MDLFGVLSTLNWPLLSSPETDEGFLKHTSFLSQGYLELEPDLRMLGLSIWKSTTTSCPSSPRAQPSAGHRAAAAKSLQSCPTLCHPTDGSPPGSPVPGILQARTLEWVAISFSNVWKWKWSRSVASDSSWPHGLQPTRLPRPWGFPGKSTGVGCHRLLCSHRAGILKYLLNIRILLDVLVQWPLWLLFVLCTAH